MSAFIDTDDFIDSQIAALFPQTYYGSLFASSVASKIIATDDPTEAKPELSLTYGEEPLRGWRQFDLATYELRDGRTEPRLQAISGDTIYVPRRRAVAVCNHTLHEAPWPTCQCGIWALPTREAAEAYQAPRILAEVALWGRVLEFEHGHRAQYAYPLRLFVYSYITDLIENKELCDELSQIYGVPVEIVEKTPLRFKSPDTQLLANGLPPSRVKIISIKLDASGLTAAFKVMQDAALETAVAMNRLASVVQHHKPLITNSLIDEWLCETAKADPTGLDLEP